MIYSTPTLAACQFQQSEIYSHHMAWVFQLQEELGAYMGHWFKVHVHHSPSSIMLSHFFS